MKVGDLCSFCKRGSLVFVGEYFPWSPDHLACPRCDSTYVLEPGYVPTPEDIKRGESDDDESPQAPASRRDAQGQEGDEVEGQKGMQGNNDDYKMGGSQE